jgi:hypothetical protein
MPGEDTQAPDEAQQPSAPDLHGLSKTMMVAVEQARRGGLVRLSGGYWIAAEDYPAEPSKLRSGRIVSVGTRTVRALEARGLLTLAPGATGPAWSRRRVLAGAPIGGA